MPHENLSIDTAARGLYNDTPTPSTSDYDDTNNPVAKMCVDIVTSVVQSVICSSTVNFEDENSTSYYTQLGYVIRSTTVHEGYGGATPYGPFKIYSAWHNSVFVATGTLTDVQDAITFHNKKEIAHRLGLTKHVRIKR